MPGSKGVHKVQAGFKRVSRGSKDASEGLGTLRSRQGIPGLRVSVTHSDAKVQVDCGRVRASRAPANRIKHSMKHDWPQNHRNPSPLGFSPEPVTSKVPQSVGFTPQPGSAYFSDFKGRWSGNERRFAGAVVSRWTAHVTLTESP